MNQRIRTGFPLIIALLLMLTAGVAYGQAADKPSSDKTSEESAEPEKKLEDQTLLLETEERETTITSWEERIVDIREGKEIDCRVYVIPARFVLKYKATFQGNENELRVSGDGAVLWQGMKEEDSDFVEFYVRGNIRLEWGNDLLRADELFFSLKYQQGVLSNFRGIFYDEEKKAEYFMRAKELRLLSTDRLEADNAVSSLTPFAIPWFSVRTERITVSPKGTERTVELENPGLYMLDTEILPLPDFGLNMDSPPKIRDIHFNTSAHRGFAIISQFDLTVIGYDLLKLYRYMERPKYNQILGDLDIYAARGVAPSLSWYYITENSHAGFNFWYLYDNGYDTERNREIGFYPLATHDRSKAEFWYLQIFPNDLRFAGQISWWSDANLLREFFESDFKIQKSRDTFAEFSQYSTQVGFRLFYRQQINDFIETIEYKPQINWYIFPQSVFELWNSSFYLHLDSDYSEIAFVPGEDSVAAASEGNRLVFSPGATWTFDLQYFSLLMRTYMTTGWYNFGSNPSDQNGPDWLTFRSEVILKTFIYKNTPGFHSTFFNIDGLKHIIMPQVSFVRQYPNNFYNNKKLKDFHYYDEVDPINEFDALVFMIKNTLYSRRNGRMITFLDVLIEQTVYPNEDRDNDGETFGELYGRFIMNPFEILTINADMLYNSVAGNFKRWSVGFRLNFEKLSFGLEQRYLRDLSVISGFDTSWRFSPVYSFSLSADYDFDKSEMQQFEVSIQRRFSSFAIGFTFKRDLLFDDMVYIFTIVPTGVLSSKNISVSSPETPK